MNLEGLVDLSNGHYPNRMYIFKDTNIVQLENGQGQKETYQAT
jgi:hypothetical protein